MKRRRLALFVLLCATLLQSGCEFKDLDKRFFVVSIGVDKSKDPKKPYHVSLKVAIPSGQVQMGKESFDVYAVDDSTISNAVQHLKANVDKEFDFGHTKMLVFGKELAEDDYRDALDWMVRARFLQQIAWVGVGSPNAEEVLRVKPNFERLPSNALFLSFGQIGVESEFTVSRYLFDFFRANEEPGSSPVLPIIKAREGHFTIDNAYVMDGKRAKLRLNADETVLFNTLVRSQNKYEYVLEQDGKRFVFHADQISVSRSLTESPKPTATVKIKLGGTLVESQDQVVKEQDLLKVSDQLGRKIQKDIKTLLEKFRDQHLDPYEFGLYYRATHWDDVDQEVAAWKKMYPSLQFDVQVKVNLRGSGVIE
ncbi:Ger(x)C family spore germination protein [Tumebacillus flagellatus]|uniref:Uncharacterized protein n=1 Tax=Tumebacillus flagellatus TaxID=1157490 RepID=A0A074LNE5_9BACL|nr:Ger(x)C family spore germination protein [Tumebacillus flagellatus]KEO82030.1 hypothetical protein EL26_17840 [Tumebacillus flagellatus]